MPFKVVGTYLNGVKLIEQKDFPDDRGYFSELYKQSDYEILGITKKIVQINHSFSRKGVIRGLHFQKPPFAQAKIVCVIRGKIRDVVVDLRSDSPTFGKHLAIEISEENGRQLFAPEGFAHGFYAVKDSHVVYCVTAEYNKEAEEGVIWNDLDLGIDWGTESPTISPRDASWPRFKKARPLDHTVRKK